MDDSSAKFNAIVLATNGTGVVASPGQQGITFIEASGSQDLTDRLERVMGRKFVVTSPGTINLDLQFASGEVGKEAQITAIVLEDLRVKP